VAELKSTFSALKRQEILLLLPLFIFSQWFLSYKGTFVATYHSVRGRALTGFLSAFAGITGTFLAGIFLDRTSIPRSKRFRWAYITIYTLYTAVMVWATVVQWWYQKTKPSGLDWKQGEFYASFLLLLLWE
jgi:ammonia channel protein AmtB